jgi:hypothetical protein
MPGRSPLFAPGVSRAARHLVAVPWRQAGLIAACALAGAAASALVSLRHPGAAAAAAEARVPAPRREAPAPEAGAMAGLRLDLEPGATAAPPADAPDAEASIAPPRPDDARRPDEIQAALSLAPPAAGSPSPGGIAAWPGLVAGLLAGLLLGGLRELRGGRMRSPREAERALGVPVLGTIPTLSAKARDACFASPDPGPERA